jgi:hypothetical protein
MEQGRTELSLKVIKVDTPMELREQIIRAIQSEEANLVLLKRHTEVCILVRH